VEKLYTYALGRPPVNSAMHTDKGRLEELQQLFIQNNYNFKQLIVDIVNSPAFQNRRGEAAGATP
jgi:hypothetical protein